MFPSRLLRIAPEKVAALKIAVHQSQSTFQSGSGSVSVSQLMSSQFISSPSGEGDALCVLVVVSVSVSAAGLELVVWCDADEFKFPSVAALVEDAAIIDDCSECGVFSSAGDSCRSCCFKEAVKVAGDRIKRSACFSHRLRACPISCLHPLLLIVGGNYYCVAVSVQVVGSRHV